MSPTKSGEKALAGVGRQPEEGPEGVKEGEPRGRQRQTSASRAGGGLAHPGLYAPAPSRALRRPLDTFWGTTHLPSMVIKQRQWGVGAMLVVIVLQQN